MWGTVTGIESLSSCSLCCNREDNEHIASMSVWETVSDNIHLVREVVREGYLKE